MESNPTCPNVAGRRGKVVKTPPPFLRDEFSVQTRRGGGLLE